MRSRIEILRDTCARHGISVELARSHNRRDVLDPQIRAARTEAIKTMRLSGFSLPLIGDVMDRHHTSILELIRKEGIER